MKKYILIALVSLITFSSKAQINQVFWKEVAGAKMTSPTSFQALEEATLAHAYSINELAPYQDGGVEATFGKATYFSTLALTKKQGQEVIVSSELYDFTYNLDFYIRPSSKGYEVNGKEIEMPISPKDILGISRKGNLINFIVNDKVIHQIEASQTQLFPLVAVVFTSSKDPIENLSFRTPQDELVLKDKVEPVKGNVMGSILIEEVYGGSAPYTYSWSHSKENSSSLKGLSSGSYTLAVTDAKGKRVEKEYFIPTQLTWIGTHTSSGVDKIYYTTNTPLSLKSHSYIEAGKNGKVEWLNTHTRGNLYVGFVPKNQATKFIENNLRYAFLLEEQQVKVVIDGKVTQTLPRSKNRNTSYSLEKKDGFILYTIEGKEVAKEKLDQDITLSVKVLLINYAKLTQLQGVFTGMDIEEASLSSTPYNQKNTTTYYKYQPVVWLNDGIENTLSALQDGKIEWKGTANAVWFESKKEVYKFTSPSATKEEIATYKIERTGYVLSFYKNAIFQYAIPTNAEESLHIHSSQSKGFDITASFGNCSSPFGPTNIWYFGDHAGLDFTTNPPTAIKNDKLYANEGCGIVSDYNGDLLFYTNGLDVWNKMHQVMPNGDGLIGHTSSSQIGLVVPAPNNPNKYYIFHSTAMEIGGQEDGIKVYYSTVIFDAQHPNGRVDQKNILLSANLEERITAVKHKTLNAYWIVSHKRNSAKFSSYLLGENGFLDPTTPSFTLAGDVASPPYKDSQVNIKLSITEPLRPFFIFGATPQDNIAPWYINGQFKFSPDGKYLAIANNQPSSAQPGVAYPGVYVMPYNAATGEVGDVKFFKVTANEASYGIEFSPSGKYLYAMRKYCNVTNIINPSDNFGLFQYEVATSIGEVQGGLVGTFPALIDANGVNINSGPIPTLGAECYGAMQLANDGKIYVTRANQEVVGVINNPEGVGMTGVAYAHQGVSLAIANTTRIEKSLFGFPSFVQSFLPCPPITFNQTTIGPLSASFYELKVTELTNIAAHEINNYSYQWSTGATTPSITVTQSGTYSLTITLINTQCQEDKSCQSTNQIEVVLAPATLCEAPLLITDIYGCNSYTLTAEAGFLDYEWNTREQGRSIVVQNAGEYIVTAFDPVLNCRRKGIFYASFNEFCYDEVTKNTTTTEYKEVLSVSVVNYSDIWLKNTSENTSKNPFLNAQRGVWRADASFAYLQDRSAKEESGGELDISKDGSFSLQMMNWKQNGNVYPSTWKKVTTLEQYNADGFEVENRDILGRYSAALYGYQNQLSTAVATNAKYHEIVFEGFEEYTPKAFESQFLTTSNLDVFAIDPLVASFSANIPVYRHYNIAWGTGSSAIVETSTGRNMSNFSASLKVMPVANQAPKIEENVNFSLTTTGIRLSQATFSGVSLPAQWKGNMAFKTTTQVEPKYELGTSVTVDQMYAHTGKKSLQVTQNVAYEQVRFDPAPGRQYVISLWVSVKDADVPTFASESVPQQEAKRGIKVKFEMAGVVTEEFFFEPTGRIIEGWQRIEGIFCVPQQYDKLYLTFQTGNETTYFDDIRIHPFNGNLQTYVYDPENYLLRAVLDRNNFATFYYYDAEQQLRLVKKETERGIKTIQEVISNMPSKSN